MRLLTSITASLCVLGKLAVAGTHSRGPEALFFYYAYRLDVEVSSAENTPWKLAPGIGENMAEDWPNNEVDTSRKGMNFHAFMTKVAKGGYGRGQGRLNIKDPWFPTMDQLSGLARWPRDDGVPLDPENSNKPNRFSYIGISPGSLLGDLNEAGKKPGNYFQFDNILAIVANRAKDVYEKNPKIGQQYYDEMRKCVQEAQVARKMDGGDHTKDTSWRLLEQWLATQPDKYKLEKRKIDKALLKQKEVKVRSHESTLFAKEKYTDMDWVTTKDDIKKNGGKAANGPFYQELFEFFKTMAADMVSCASTFLFHSHRSLGSLPSHNHQWQAGANNLTRLQENARIHTLGLIDASSMNDAAKTRARTALEGLDVAHRRTIDRLRTLDQAMNRQGARADGAAAGCGFPDVTPPEMTKLRRTLKAKRRMSKAKRRGVHGQCRKSRRA
jgi:hypothetical protein